MKRIPRRLLSTVSIVLGALILCHLPSWGGEESLLTLEGTPQKLITRRRSALYREADDLSPNEPVDVFSFFYVLPTQVNGAEKLQDGFYRVAYAAETPRQAGWLKAEDVVEWDHAQVAGFTSYGGRDRVLFFASEQDAIDWYLGKPEAEQKAISREPAQKQQALFPLLAISEFQHDGDEIPVYQLAYLSGDSLPSTPELRATSNNVTAAPTAHAKMTREQLQRDFKLQVTFVMDSTASMTPWIEAMKEVIATLSTKLAGVPSLAGRIEFAVVTYRDQLAPGSPDQDSMEYVSRRICDLTSDHALFQQQLATVNVAPVDSEDFAEDILAGLKTALDEVTWTPAAHKAIVLIGDAPAQVATDGYKNVTKLTFPGLVALAQPTGAQATFEQIQVHGLRIVSEDAEVCRRHFDQLTAGRQHPGLHYAYEGTGDASQFIADLVARLTELAETTQKVVEGRFEELEDEASAASPGSLQARLLGPVMEMLRATELGSPESTFEQGYAIVLDREGNRALEPHVLVNQAQIKLFESALNHIIVSLESSGDPGSRNVTKLVQALQILATGINLQEDVHPDMPLAEILTMMLGFPVRNSIFSITPKKLAAMTSSDYQRWVDQVRASQSITKAHLENGSLWFQMGGGTRSHDAHAFIKVSDLP
ncbi:MAG: hypothetical protein KDA93_01615 [Planctomycetaceae bacterium]|nr:hypothetical protein [Planctomycetaceae bacterium]